jgi:hypothetical protein
MPCKVLRYFILLHSPFLFRLTVSRNLKEVLKKLNELVLEMHKLGLVERRVATQALYRQTHVPTDKPTEIFGRDDNKEAAVKLLLDQ